VSGNLPEISLFRNVSWGGGAAAVRLVFGLCSLFLSIRLVGSEAYGYLTLMLAVCAFYVALVNSVHTIAVTFAVERRKSSKSEMQLLHLFSAVWMTTLISVALLNLTAVILEAEFVLGFIYRGDDPALLRNLDQLVHLVVVLTSCQLVIGGGIAVIEGLGRFDLAARVQMIGPPAVFVLLLTGFLMDGRTSLLYVGSCYLAGAVLEMIIATGLRWRVGFRRALWPSTKSLSMLSELLRNGLLLQGASLVNIFFDPFNKFLLNYFVGPNSVTAYDVATKIVSGIRGLFSGAFRVFLQLADKLGSNGGEDYRKVLRYGIVPALTMHGVGAVLLSLVSHFWLGGEVKGLLLFYFLLLPASLGIIFAAPLYAALIGIRDLAFIFRMHVNLAVLNIAASTLLIPLFGLYGAGVGLMLTTAYNAVAEYKRYIRRIGAIKGLGSLATELRTRFALAAVLGLVALLADRWVVGGGALLAIQSMLLVGFSLLFLHEPLARRMLDALRHRFGRTV
jgi:O-antigen/teichoic acid export membrane protein